MKSIYSMKAVFWWNIPCAGMINVLKAYCEEIDDECVVVTGQLSQSRKAMGWDDKGSLFRQHQILSENEWLSTGIKLIDKYSDRLHVFNGITYPDRMKSLMQYAISKNVPFCNMSEAYFNLENGWHKILKNIYLNCVLPFKAHSITTKSLGVICLSGDSERDTRQFENLGFNKQDIYPFGYYTHVDETLKYSPTNDGKIHLLCPGLLEPYKGVDILVEALNLLFIRGVKNFVCHITGKGSMKTKLRQMIDNFGISDYIKLEGVMHNEAYSELMSRIDILVAPGRVEPWGIRINEAIQRGQAVVVSDGLGAYTLIKRSNGGKVFPSGNCRALADALKNLLTDPQELANARKNNISFRPEISCSTQAKRLHSHICEIMRKHLSPNK